VASHQFAARVLVTDTDGAEIPSEEKRAPQARFPGEISALARELRAVEAGLAVPR
jgi:hypothetical protein